MITSTTAITASVPSQNSTFFDDFYTGANMASDPIGRPRQKLSPATPTPIITTQGICC